MAIDHFELVRSIIHDCPALKLPQSFMQRLGMTAQIVPLKGLTDEQAQTLVDRLNRGDLTALPVQTAAGIADISIGGPLYADGVAAPSAEAQPARNWNPEPPCWLVEKREQGRTVGYLGHRLGTSEWMATPDLATRFVRHQDANGVAECFEHEDVIVAEHVWG